MKRRMCLCLAAVFLALTQISLSAVAQGAQQEADLLFQQAVDCDREGDNDAAIRLTLQSLRIVDAEQHWQALSWFCFKGGWYKEGVQSAERAIYLNPGDWQAHINLAANAYRFHALDKAREHNEAALANPNIDRQHIREAEEGLALLQERNVTVQFPIPNDGATHHFAIPVSTNCQKFAYEVVGATSKLEKAGDQQVIALKATASDAMLILKVHTDPFGIEKGINNTLPGDPEHYRQPSDRINFTNPTVREVLGKLPPTTDPIQRAKDASTWLSRNIKYQLNYEAPTAAETLQRRFAECREFSEAFTALMRASGYPCRVVNTYGKYVDGKSGRLKGHLVAEFYNYAAKSWIIVDPQEPWTVGMLPNGFIRMCHYDDVGLKRWMNDDMGSDIDTPTFIEK